MDINKILSYQKIDGEIRNYEKEINNSEEKKAINNFTNHLKEVREKSIELEKQSFEINKYITELKKTYMNNIKIYENISKKDIEGLSEKELEDYTKVTNDIISNLNFLEKKIMQQAERVDKVVGEYSQAKKKYNIAKEKVNELKAKLAIQTLGVQPQIDDLKKQLQTMEKDIDAKVLEKYKIKRQDKLFPVFVPVSNDACGGCRMELPSALREKLKKDGFLECENCHRIIYEKT